MRHRRAGSGPSPGGVASRDTSKPAGGAGRTGLIVALEVDELAAHALDRPAEQARDMHLGDAHAGGDLVLGQLLDIAQEHDLALPLRQPPDQLGQDQQVLQLLAVAPVDHEVAEDGVAVLAGRLVQGRR